MTDPRNEHTATVRHKRSEIMIESVAETLAICQRESPSELTVAHGRLVKLKAERGGRNVDGSARTIPIDSGSERRS